MLDCYRSGEPVQVDDLASTEGRWPGLVPLATGVGFAQLRRCRCDSAARCSGGLEPVSFHPGRLEPGEVAAAQALADVATIAILQHRAAVGAQALSDQLHLALNSRIAIEQAKGVIAERLGVDMEEAFTLLRGHARSHGRQLSEVAEGVADGRISVGELVAGYSA